MYTIGEFASIGRVSVRMLRHYDAVGLLKPARVDPYTGYRSYDDSQFGRLLQVLDYKSLGLRLDAIVDIVDGSADPADVEALLVERRDQLQVELARGTAALARVEAKLHHLRGAPPMSRTTPTVTPTLGSTPAVRVAELTEPVPEIDSSVISPVIGPMFDRLAGLLADAAIEPVGPPIALYTVGDTVDDSGPAVVHAAFPVSPQVESGPAFEIAEYPPVPSYAALTHLGSMDTISDSWQTLGRWIDEQPDLRPRGDCREVYLVTSPMDDQSGWVTELQWPVERR